MKSENLLNRKKILLTGVSGTVGFEVLKQLYELKNNYEITVFDVKSAKAEKKFQPFKNDITIVYGNISSEADLLNVCYKKDVVIHLAAIIPPLADDKPELSYEVNTLGTQKLIALLELHSPKAFFLYSSSISVYGDRLLNPMISVHDPLIPSEGDEYAKTKILAEKSVQNSKLDWSIFRLAAIMGGHKISKLMFHQPLATSMEIATPRDTARAFVNAITKQQQLSKTIYNLGGGENCRISYEDFLTRSFEINGLGKPNFVPKTFAEKNFHCGFYEDGWVLNNIVNFQQDDLNSFFALEEKKISGIQKMFASLFKSPIKKYLQNQSEPLKAYLEKDTEVMEHYFNT